MRKKQKSRRVTRALSALAGGWLDNSWVLWLLGGAVEWKELEGECRPCSLDSLWKRKSSEDLGFSTGKRNEEEIIFMKQMDFSALAVWSSSRSRWCDFWMDKYGVGTPIEQRSKVPLTHLVLGWK